MGDGAALVESLKSGRLLREGGGHVHEMINIPSMQSVVRILPIWAGMRAVLECKWAFEFCREYEWALSTDSGLEFRTSFHCLIEKNTTYFHFYLQPL